MLRPVGAALLLAGCASMRVPPAVAVHEEAVSRLQLCVDADPAGPFEARDGCLKDVLAWCTRQGVVCDGEELWRTVQFDLP